MKYAFFVVVLANVILFLWEFQHGGFQHETDYSRQASNKQILLLSEWLQQEAANKEAVADVIVAEPETVIESSATDQQPKDSDTAIVVAQKVNEPGVETEQSELVIADQEQSAEPGILDDEEVVAVNDESKSLEAKEASTSEEQKTEPEATLVVEQEPETQKVKTALPELVVADKGKSAESGISNKDGLVDQLKTAAKVDEREAALQSHEDVQSTSKVVEPELPAKVEVCYEVGPFSDQKQLQKWLASEGIKDKPESFYKEEPFVSSYLVYYPASETMAESKRNVTMLQNKGIEELWLFKKGEMMGAISLGLFKEKPHAEKLFQKLLNKGINVKITERFKSEQRLYTKVRQAVAGTANSAVGISECQ